MTKAELVDQVATTVQLSKHQTATVLTQCLQAIMEALQAGERVDLRGFGRFQLRHRPHFAFPKHFSVLLWGDIEVNETFGFWSKALRIACNAVIIA